MGERFGGRAKGTPNKVTRDLREMILGALDDAGGRKYLASQAKENPAAFMSLIGRCLPKDITNSDGSLSEAFRSLILEEASAGAAAEGDTRSCTH
jgi:hypothetical protein